MQPELNHPPTFSVSELNREAKHLLEGHFDWVSVEGEIGNFTAAASGHWYFTLKDNDAQVRCAMFRRANSRLKYRPNQGESVQIRAKVSLYEGRGEFQLICEHMAPAGAGALQLAFERLKNRLSAEGLFNVEHKSIVPSDAEHIGVVTSPTGAALQDILTVLGRRSPHTTVSVFPVAVQGEGAAEQIAAAIQRADELVQTESLRLDALIVGRGGGSLEDLWAFNEEVVARALFAAKVPTVSAVGHEVDFSIADLVADVRAATPSAAAELVSADQTELLQHLDGLSDRMTRSVNRLNRDLSGQLLSLRKRLRHPGYAVRQQQAALTRYRSSLGHAVQRHIVMRESASRQLIARLKSRHPRQQLENRKLQRTQLSHQLGRQIRQRLRGARAEVAHQQKLLSSLGPEQTLNRGYAIVSDAAGKVVRGPGEVTSGDALQVRVKGGVISTEVSAKNDA
ncbi:MAG: exodeoxyribonuclease VII large subunit [Luminiphilus sp.]|nr:exodeoxyribonuclease VII large subunit [Luminiphilus sp.]